MKFHNGAPFTAQAVVEDFKRLTTGENAFFAGILKINADSTKAVDDYTVDITTTGTVLLPSQLVHPIFGIPAPGTDLLEERIGIRDKDDKKLKLELVCCLPDPTLNGRTSELVQAQLNAVGIDVTITNMPDDIAYTIASRNKRATCGLLRSAQNAPFAMTASATCRQGVQHSETCMLYAILVPCF